MTSPGPLQQRRAGVLLHPTSLPNTLGKGDIGPQAYRFVEFLAASGMTVWQILPLGPTHVGDSPYNSASVSAGNPQLISLELLVEQGWLSAESYRVSHSLSRSGQAAMRRILLREAYQGFLSRAAPAEQEALSAFVIEQRHWLEDYALYQAYRDEHHNKPWTHWPAGVRDRHPDVLATTHVRLQKAITQVCFEQFLFFRQWFALKDYAHQHGIQLFGDIPIFVAYDSADVWANRRYFDLDEDGQPRTVSGVPPDYFSPQGQRWGHPQYNWQMIEADNFRYWTERMQWQMQLFDMVRIDHFRGLEAYWEIPATNPTAIEGKWVKAPGDALLKALKKKFGALRLVAEDLGTITPEVYTLRNKYKLPGMNVLQFAFDGSSQNPYLPHRHERNSVVYTGTHDNETTLGWFNNQPPQLQHYINDYLDSPAEPMPWPLIRCALASVAAWAIIPMQDILMLDDQHRMNTPGTSNGNWQWQFAWEQLPLDMSGRLHHLNQLYGRIE